MTEQEQWKLQTYTYFTVTCSICNWAPTEQADSPEQAVKQWTEWGWHLSENGPICPYCDERKASSPDPIAQARGLHLTSLSPGEQGWTR